MGKVKRGGKVYKYKSEDSEGKEIAPRKGKPTETRQTIKFKNAEKGEVKKTKSKGYVGGPKANKAAGLKETYKEKVKGGKNRKYTVDDDGYLKDKKGNNPSPLNKKDKVLVSKTKKRATKGHAGWIASEDVKTKRVNEKRADRMEKRGWKKHSPMNMNRYDKDMEHERELIYDAKGQLHKADQSYHHGAKRKKQEMIHDRELIHDAKKDIWDEDKKKWEHDGSPFHMSRDLSYGGPVIDQEPGALSHMGASKVLKHMKSRM